MAYKHILIAVDLSPESKVLVEKAVSMARPYNAKVSLIHVDVNYSDLYTGLIDVNLGDMQKRISEETHHALSELSTNAGYPITETLSGSGDLGPVGQVIAIDGGVETGLIGAHLGLPLQKRQRRFGIQRESPIRRIGGHARRLGRAARMGKMPARPLPGPGRGPCYCDWVSALVSPPMPIRR